MGIGRGARLGKGIRTRATRWWRNYQDNSGSACLPITLGDLEETVDFVGNNYESLIEVTGGTGDATLTLESGTLPPDLEIMNAGAINGLVGVLSSASFGIWNFTIGGTRNGCAITPKEFTIEVWKSVTATGGVIAPLDEIFIPVSGIPVVYGTGVLLHSVEITLDGAITNAPILASPDYEQEVYLAENVLLGNITNAVIHTTGSGYPEISTGSTPYTGNWDANLTYPFSTFNGVNTIGNWIMYNLQGTSYTVILIFKPV